MFKPPSCRKSLSKILLLSLYIFISIQIVPLASEKTPKIRVKRNLGQLIALIYKETNYKFMKLANYGNWCGKGGDLMGDGSFVDGCDLCCKSHDNCYNKTRHAFEDCTPLLTIYDYNHGESNPDDHDKDGKKLSSEEIAKRKLPSCNPVENEAPSCKQGTCECDIEFVMCLKTEPCPPEKVHKRGGYWFWPF